MAKGKKGDDLGMTPAAIGALARGDLGNALAAMLPGGIEAQEAAGQRELTRASSSLPINGTLEGNYGRERPELRPQWEAVGFTFGKPVPNPHGRPPIFVEATFPPGWSLKPTDHSMWSHVIDAKGRKRASVFFKAAFYDYNAHTFGLECRYVVEGEYGPAPDHALTAYIVKDADGEKAIHRVPVPAGAGYDERTKYSKAAEAWLAEHFPDHANPLVYWD